MNAGTIFEQSMAGAERACFDRLISTTRATPGKNAFIGRWPGLVNSWYFGLSEIPGQYGSQFENNCAIESLAMYARAEGYFERREDAQRWMMQCIGATPWCNGGEKGNVASFRVRSDGVEEIQFRFIEFADNKTYGVWLSRIGFDVVFLTGGQSCR